MMSFHSPFLMALLYPDLQYMTLCGTPPFSPVMKGSRLTPSYSLSAGRGVPLISAEVTKKSIRLIGSWKCLPSGSFPFHLTMQGILSPPSKLENFPPFKGALSVAPV